MLMMMSRELTHCNRSIAKWWTSAHPTGRDSEKAMVARPEVLPIALITGTLFVTITTEKT